MNAFKGELRALIAARIKRELADGTVGMSRDNLWQCIKISGANAPRGTNAAYYAKQAFNEVIDADPKFKKFTTL